MPRSRRRIDIDNQAIERGKEVIRLALDGFKGKRQATVIQERIQGRISWSRKIENDRPLRRYLTNLGLKSLIRDALAEWGYGSEDETPPQLELFPVEERKLVRQIGMARIWVPSRNAHIQYHDEPATVLKEASDYYISLGKGINRKGVLLGQLAEVRKGRAPETKAA
jgi:hypothetical protein